MDEEKFSRRQFLGMSLAAAGGAVAAAFFPRAASGETPTEVSGSQKKTSEKPSESQPEVVRPGIKEWDKWVRERKNFKPITEAEERRFKEEGEVVDFNSSEWQRLLEQELPSEFSWDNVEDSSHNVCPENPFEQLTGDCGLAALATLWRIKSAMGVEGSGCKGDKIWRSQTPDRTLNPAFLAALLRNDDTPHSTLSAIEVLRKNGVCVNSRELGETYQEIARKGEHYYWSEFYPTAGQFSNAAKHKVEGRILIPADGLTVSEMIDQCKAYLYKKGPFLTWLIVFSTLFAPTNGIIRAPDDPNETIGRGVHAVLITGWKEPMEDYGLKILNSWGSSWGKNGAGFLTKGYLERGSYYPLNGFDIVPKVVLGTNCNKDFIPIAFDQNPPLR